MLSSVRAGFPSPADDYIEKAVDLNDLLVRHPVAPFYLRARGDSMEGAGIKGGAILIVDRSLTARDGDVVAAIVDGNLTVKRPRKDRKDYWLEAAPTLKRERTRPASVERRQVVVRLRSYFLARFATFFCLGLCFAGFLVCLRAFFDLAIKRGGLKN